MNTAPLILPYKTINVEMVPCPGCGTNGYKYITSSTDFDYHTTDMVFQIVQCLKCGLFYVNPRPGIEEISKIYPEKYSAYHFSNIRNRVIRRARTFIQAGKARRILRCVCNLDGDVRILDVGCGGPILLMLIRNICQRGIKLYGNDFNHRALHLIEQEGFQTIPGKFEEINWEHDFFDVIVLNQVIEHLFDAPGVLRKSFNFLKQGGALYIETPSLDGLDARLFRKNHWGGYHIPRHLQFFNRETITQTLSRYGFEIEQVAYLPSPNFWTSSFRNLLAQKGFPSWWTKRMNYRNIVCMTVFTCLDLCTRMFFPTSNMWVIARKP